MQEGEEAHKTCWIRPNAGMTINLWVKWNTMPLWKHLNLPPHPTCSVPDWCVRVFAPAALPGESGVPGAGSSQREAAAGGDAHGPGGGHAQRPPPPGSGELHHGSAGRPPSGRSPSSLQGTAHTGGVGALGTEGPGKETWEVWWAPQFVLSGGCGVAG